MASPEQLDVKKGWPVRLVGYKDLRGEPLPRFKTVEEAIAWGTAELAAEQAREAREAARRAAPTSEALEDAHRPSESHPVAE